jgi:hypothetical protein
LYVYLGLVHIYGKQQGRQGHGAWQETTKIHITTGVYADTAKLTVNRAMGCNRVGKEEQASADPCSWQQKQVFGEVVKQQLHGELRVVVCRARWQARKCRLAWPRPVKPAGIRNTFS